MGVMQVSVQFPGISVTILNVLYDFYIIITSVHQQFESIGLISPELQRLEK